MATENRAGNAQPEAQEWRGPGLQFKSVGIDIGSTTSHLTFSSLILARDPHSRWGRFQIAERKVIHRSKVIFTPYQPDGAIVTGEAARRDNADRVAQLFADQSGKFVCATAGPVLEAIMAAYGSGAAQLSRSMAGATLLNVDIGGSTTKFAVVRDGKVMATAAVNVGGRLVSWDEKEQVTRWETFGRIVAQDLGIAATEGAVLAAHDKATLAATLAGVIVEVAQRGELSSMARKLMITPPLSYREKVDGIVFSGGAAEYFYRRESQEYGDLGKPLAEALRAVAARLEDIQILEAAECLRATVIGASQYTVQVSGSTIFASSDGVFPLHNVPVLLQRFSTPPTEQSIVASVKEKIAAFGHDPEGPLALAFELALKPNYALAQTVARAVATVAAENGRKKWPLILIFDQDMAGVTGEILVHDCQVGSDIVCVDEIELKDFDYIDIGAPLIKPGTFSDHTVVPVIVKSLVFAA